MAKKWRVFDISVKGMECNRSKNESGGIKKKNNKKDKEKYKKGRLHRKKLQMPMQIAKKKIKKK